MNSTYTYSKRSFSGKIHGIEGVMKQVFNSSGFIHFGQLAFGLQANDINMTSKCHKDFKSIRIVLSYYKTYSNG